MSEHICNTYLIARAATIVRLEQEVNKLMEAEWIPLGPVVMGNSTEVGRVCLFFQTMTKPREL